MRYLLLALFLSISVAALAQLGQNARNLTIGTASPTTCNVEYTTAPVEFATGPVQHAC